MLDLGLIYLSFLGAYWGRIGGFVSTDFPFWPYAQISLIAALVWWGVLLLSTYYRIPPRTGVRAWYDFGSILLGALAGISTLVLIYFFQRELFFSRLVNVYVLVLGLGGLWGSRALFLLWLKQAKKQGKALYKTLIIGANHVSQRLIRSIDEDPYTPYQVIGVIDPYGFTEPGWGSVPLLGKLDRLQDLIESERATALIQCDAFEHTLNLIAICKKYQLKFHFEPALRGVYDQNLRLRMVAGQILVSYVERDFPRKIKTRYYQFVDWVLRHVFDID